MIEPSLTQEALYDRLMRLKPDGLSTRAWTINAGVSSAFFDQLASGGTPRDGELAKILAVVGVTVGAFEGRKRPSASATPPTLRVMAREPKPVVVQPDPVEPPAPPAPAADAEIRSVDEAVEPAPPVAPSYVEATAQAIDRWLEARRQALAVGIDTSGIEGARIVTDLARLAFDLEQAPKPANPSTFADAG